MPPEAPEIVKGELVPYEPPAAPITLFGTSDPRVALERMADVATALVDVIEQRGLYATIGGKRHVTAEGWTTLGGMLGVVPVVTETRANDSGDGIVARVEARTLDGRVVGAAEAECSRAEARWRSRDPFALRSMAQTRAISRALRAPLGQIVVLAGYEPAGADEMPAEPAPDDGKIRELLEQLADTCPDTDWPQSAREFAGVPGEMLTATIAGQLIRWLEQMTNDDNAADARREGARP
jgi:hypothetical protein